MMAIRTTNLATVATVHQDNSNNNNNNNNDNNDNTPNSPHSPYSPKSHYVQHSVLSKIGKWNKLQNYGHFLLGNAIIPLKTPIDDKYLRGTHWPRFSIHDFVYEQWRDYGRYIGMMIDLSNHDCIYDYENVHLPIVVSSDNEGVIGNGSGSGEQQQHEPLLPPPSVKNNAYERDEQHYQYMQLIFTKHPCISKECPDLDHIRSFSKIVNDYKHQYPNYHIGVHCSYGFNRTGFVVCSYLIENCGMTVAEAVRALAETRPPGIKHKWFIDELYMRYDANYREQQRLKQLEDGGAQQQQRTLEDLLAEEREEEEREERELERKRQETVREGAVGKSVAA